MKKSELKKLLKPMIRECIKEVIFEEGVLSGIVSEVASGLGKPTLIESKRSHSSREVAEDNRITKQQVALAKRREDLLSSINKDAYGGVDLLREQRLYPVVVVPAPLPQAKVLYPILTPETQE